MRDIKVGIISETISVAGIIFCNNLDHYCNRRFYFLVKLLLELFSFVGDKKLMVGTWVVV